MGIGDWGLGIGDWGFGPNPQSPIPITTDIKNKSNIYIYCFIKKIKNNKINNKYLFIRFIFIFWILIIAIYIFR